MGVSGACASVASSSRWSRDARPDVLATDRRTAVWRVDCLRARHAGAVGHLLASARRPGDLADAPCPAQRPLLVYGDGTLLAESRMALGGVLLRALSPGRDATLRRWRRGVRDGRAGDRLPVDGWSDVYALPPDAVGVPPHVGHLGPPPADRHAVHVGDAGLAARRRAALAAADPLRGLGERTRRGQRGRSVVSGGHRRRSGARAARRRRRRAPRRAPLPGGAALCAGDGADAARVSGLALRRRFAGPVAEERDHRMAAHASDRPVRDHLLDPGCRVRRSSDLATWAIARTSSKWGLELG